MCGTAVSAVNTVCGTAVSAVNTTADTAVPPIVPSPISPLPRSPARRNGTGHPPTGHPSLDGRYRARPLQIYGQVVFISATNGSMSRQLTVPSPLTSLFSNGQVGSPGANIATQAATLSFIAATK